MNSILLQISHLNWLHEIALCWGALQLLIVVMFALDIAWRTLVGMLVSLEQTQLLSLYFVPALLQPLFFYAITQTAAAATAPTCWTINSSVSIVRYSFGYSAPWCTWYGCKRRQHSMMNISPPKNRKTSCYGRVASIVASLAIILYDSSVTGMIWTMLSVLSAVLDMHPQ